MSRGTLDQVQGRLVSVNAVPVAEVTRLFVHDRDDLDGLRHLASLEALPEDWRRLFRERTRAVG